MERLPAMSMMVISGSLPDGCRSDLPARLALEARQAGVAVIADLQGVLLEATTEAAPWMVKPSLEELARHLG